MKGEAFLMVNCDGGGPAFTVKVIKQGLSLEGSSYPFQQTLQGSEKKSRKSVTSIPLLLKGCEPESGRVERKMNFEEKVEPEIPALRRLAVYLCPDRDMADDVVQKTLIRAYQQWGDFRQESEPGPWLRTILRYFVQAELKELTRQRERRRRYRDEWLLTVTLEDEGGHDPLENLEVCRGNLAPASAELIRLKYEADLSCKDIATKLDRSVSWVTTTLARVRSTLKTCLESRRKECDDER